jgi:RHS repeat-associated protein
LEEYSYRGLGTVVKRAHPQPGIDLTYIEQTGDPALPSAEEPGDKYKGLDRFGRVRDQRWIPAASPTSPTDRFQYGYDRNNNRLFRDNLINNDFDELYHSGAGYDGLNQMVGFARGALNTARDSVSSPFCSQTWTLDTMGNWSTFGACTGSQTRTRNKQNQTTQVGSNNLAFDNNGNTLTDETGKQFVYDAWNRLVKVKNSGGTLLVSYSYDALGRRLQEAINGGTTRDLYYSDQWQVLEDKVASGSGTAQYVWSPVYVDAMVLRDRDTNGDSTLDERLYVQQDANFNTTAVLNTAGAVLERYVYDPYGRFTDREGIDTATLDANWGERGASSYAWNYLHQGGRYDITGGLYHFRHRDYSPTLGRWMQLDPKRYEAGDMNLYRYVAGDPVSATDPSGQDCPGCTVPGGDNFNDCKKACCAQHDQCFWKNKCSKWSRGWNGAGYIVGGAIGMFLIGKLNKCAGCNNAVAACFTVCTANPDFMNGKPLYFCMEGPKEGRFIRIPGHYPNLAAAKEACCDPESK